MDLFCGIYGIGAVCIIVFSQYFNKNNFTLFCGGFFIGSLTEYVISFLVETLLNTQWWDYSHNLLDINGRICLEYSIFWGILTLILIKKFNPILDKFLAMAKRYIPTKTSKVLIIFVIVFLFIDCLVTCFAQDAFITRMVVENNIKVKDIERREEDYKKIKENVVLNKFIDTYWNNKKMIRTFPNIKVEDSNKNIVYLDSLLPDIQPYYKKIFEK